MEKLIFNNNELPDNSLIIKQQYRHNPHGWADNTMTAKLSLYQKMNGVLQGLGDGFNNQLNNINIKIPYDEKIMVDKQSITSLLKDTNIRVFIAQDKTENPNYYLEIL